jgi:hypothetical protein
MDYKELQTAYEQMLELNLNISSYIEQDKIEEIRFLIDEKKVLNQKIKKILEAVFLSTEQKASLSEITDVLKKKEEEIIIELNAKKEQLHKKLVNISQNSTKLISAYTIMKKEIKPKLFDSCE